MAVNLQTVERKFFRALNRNVEPAVRKGLFSSRRVPGGLIVLETTGFKTGATRRTPLMANRIGRYVFVATARGERSFWVKNLQKQPHIRYHLGGRELEAEAFLMLPGDSGDVPSRLPPFIARLIRLFSPLREKGWAFAVLETER